MARTREQCIDAAAQALVAGRLADRFLTCREIAEQAWTPTSKYSSIDELEDVLRAERGMPPIHDAKSA